MRKIIHTGKRWSGRVNCLHVETTLGIINITTGLTDMKGRPVDSIEVIPDKYAGEKKVMLRGLCNTRLVQCKTVTN